MRRRRAAVRERTRRRRRRLDGRARTSEWWRRLVGRWQVVRLGRFSWDHPYWLIGGILLSIALAATGAFLRHERASVPAKRSVLLEAPEFGSVGRCVVAGQELPVALMGAWSTLAEPGEEIVDVPEEVSLRWF